MPRRESARRELAVAIADLSDWIKSAGGEPARCLRDGRELPAHAIRDGLNGFRAHHDRIAALYDRAGRGGADPMALRRVGLAMMKWVSWFQDDPARGCVTITAAARRDLRRATRMLQAPAGRERRTRRRRRPPEPRPLTEKQMDVVQLLAVHNGSWAAVARAMNLDRKTVKEHYAAALRKLDKPT